MFLSGVGGVGKSELAAQYARRQAGKGKTVVRLSYSPGQPGAEDPIEASGLRRLLLELPVLEAPAACAGPPPPGGEERLRYYQAKLFCLRRICNRDTLFVVDNFDVDWDMGMEDLQSLGAQVLLHHPAEIFRALCGRRAAVPGGERRVPAVLPPRPPGEG